MVEKSPWFMDFDCSLCVEVQKIKYRKCWRCIHNPFASAKYPKDQFEKVAEALEKEIVEMQRKADEDLARLRLEKRKI